MLYHGDVLLGNGLTMVMDSALAPWQMPVLPPFQPPPVPPRTPPPTTPPRNQQVETHLERVLGVRVWLFTTTTKTPLMPHAMHTSLLPPLNTHARMPLCQQAGSMRQRRSPRQRTLAEMDSRRCLGSRTGPGQHGGDGNADGSREGTRTGGSHRDDDSGTQGGNDPDARESGEGIGSGCSTHSCEGGCTGGGGGGGCSSGPDAAACSKKERASAREKEKAKEKHRNRVMNSRAGGGARPITSAAAEQLAKSMDAYLAAGGGQPDEGQEYSIDDPYQAYGLESARQDYGRLGQQEW